MKLGMNFAIALEGLRANKLRAALTMLGMLIGVTSVIVLLAIGNGAQASITGSFNALGTNLIFVRPGSTQQGGVSQGQGSASTLTLEDAKALQDPVNAPAVAVVAPEVQASVQVVAGSLNTRTRAVGVTDAHQTVRNYQVAEGSFITADQVQSKGAVAVLGSNVAQQLFPNGNALGQTVKINSQPFRVTGVLASKGGTGLGSDDDQVLLPVTTVQQRLATQRTIQGAHVVTTINIQAVSEKQTAQAKAEITAILRERHKITGDDDFTVTSQQDTLNTLNQITGIFTIFLGAIAGISLLVGGIGIMNIMLVSVTERTREIGIRKALGAAREDILAQFLVESVVISGLGGIAGVMLGIGISRLISTVLSGQGLTTVVSPGTVLLSLAVSAGIGVFFGIYPAYQAAKLNPIQALRYE